MFIKSAGFALVLAALGMPCHASPIYEINFTGTLTSGTAKDFDLSTKTSATVGDLTGLTVSGSMIFDLGTAPTPTVSVDSSGFTNTSIQSTGGPVFVSESLTINGLVVPADFLQMPTTFNLAPVPSLPSSSTVTQNEDVQLLRFSAKPIVSPQSILSEMNLINSWTGPQVSGGDDISLDLLISSGQPFFAVPPAGEFPASWGPVATGGNGVFTLSELLQNSTIPANFGLISDYSVIGSFTFDSVNGFLVPLAPTPEPRTLPIMVVALVGFAVAVARSRRDRRAFSDPMQPSKCYSVSFRDEGGCGT
jgi:hypothetical protein